jgi:virginiamycin B lyase
LSGGIAEYVLPNSGSGPTGVAPAPDGNIWFAEYAADKIGRVNLNSVPIDITEFAVGPRRFVAAAGARPRIP